MPIIQYAKPNLHASNHLGQVPDVNSCISSGKFFDKGNFNEYDNQEENLPLRWRKFGAQHRNASACLRRANIRDDKTKESPWI
jgi:hypothetical protein